MSIKHFLCLTLLAGLLAGCRSGSAGKFTSWEIYRGDGGSNAYSQLDQINTGNVKQLKVAWVYRTGDMSGHSTLQCNPLIIDNILYGISPGLKAFALNAETGEKLWVFDPFEKKSKDVGVSRGLTHWKDGNEQRIFMFAGNRMIALDAKTGKQVMNFGTNGFVDLNQGLKSSNGVGQNQDVGNTSPGVIYGDLIIIGSSVGEVYNSAPGHIRAFDVRTGKMKWIFRTIPQPGEFGYETWPVESYKTAGGCNAWSGLSIDKKRGIVFAATGAPSFDFHGGDRIGQNLFGNSVIALDAATGKYIWHYQVSHHDLWDYDLPSPPNLITIKNGDKSVEAVAQVTKQGFIFLFERETGKPIFPVEERAVPRSNMPDEQSWPTQPIPAKPLPLSRQKFDESIITDLSPESHDYVLNEAKKYDWGDIYLPPSTHGTIQLPGMRGGAEWSGAAFDFETGIMYVGINDIPNIVQLVEQPRNNPGEFANMPMVNAGEILYQRNCAVCHGEDKKGMDVGPSLWNIEARLKSDDVRKILEKRSGLMPSFNNLPEKNKESIIAFLLGSKDTKIYPADSMTGKSIINADAPKRYSLKGYTQLKDQNGYPGTKPPWGTLNAVNLNTGDIVWKIPLGEFPELVKKGHSNTGTQLFGGCIVTAGGLVFIGASQDEKFRAIDKNTGEVKWEYQLPAGGYATPATYEVNGRQYIVIAAGGGGRQATKAGDYYIAFALN